ncbi:uncharacterized protein AMSG_06510 [Thecamonas trahens ATCC 50062]|uniref:Uncharacterized protein n=1 Tax=Thecamonas trahens ATCC 50062 TaxID=461836 RepID=A0A0L0DFT4_THETB|nr:hypothetical protein AMSG_06510 [Thecamonas trahens ATCC 50062]KNC51159.1 hypothetical protein AMSG_06510 [Thecamonas trahens ATCC 50062]|eukprot:XP_013756361.1 hypothetical protein AMSG_06510 [Thecamonas trahens ATCC 50062]
MSRSAPARTADNDSSYWTVESADVGGLETGDNDASVAAGGEIDGLDELEFSCSPFVPHKALHTAEANLGQAEAALFSVSLSPSPAAHPQSRLQGEPELELQPRDLSPPPLPPGDNGSSPPAAATRPAANVAGGACDNAAVAYGTLGQIGTLGPNELFGVSSSGEGDGGRAGTFGRGTGGERSQTPLGSGASAVARAAMLRGGSRTPAGRTGTFGSRPPAGRTGTFGSRPNAASTAATPLSPQDQARANALARIRAEKQAKALSPGASPGASPGVSPGASPPISPRPTPVTAAGGTRPALTAALTVLEDREKMLNQLQAVHEALVREKVFAREMELLVDGFGRKLGGHGMLTPKEHMLVFSMFEPILALARSLVDVLMKYRSSPEGVEEFGAQLAANLSMAYRSYVTSHIKAIATLMSRCEEHETLSARVEHLEDSLGAFLVILLVRPVQHLRRYPHMVRNLIRAGGDGPATAGLRTALDSVQQTLGVFEESIKRANARLKLESVAAVIDASDALNLVSPLRRFVRAGFMRKFNRGRAQKRHFFLFNDLLVYCKAKLKAGKWVCQGSIPLAEAVVADVPPSKRPSTHFYLTRIGGKRYELDAASSLEKKLWMDALKKCIKDAESSVVQQYEYETGSGFSRDESTGSIHADASAAASGAPNATVGTGSAPVLVSPRGGDDDDDDEVDPEPEPEPEAGPLPLVGEFATAATTAPDSRDLDAMIQAEVEFQMTKLDATDVRTWAAVDVGVWLDHIGCGEFSDAFVEKGVDGTALGVLDEDIVRLLGVEDEAQVDAILSYSASMTGRSPSILKLTSSQSRSSLMLKLKHGRNSMSTSAGEAALLQRKMMQSRRTSVIDSLGTDEFGKLDAALAAAAAAADEPASDAPSPMPSSRAADSPLARNHQVRLSFASLGNVGSSSLRESENIMKQIFGDDLVLVDPCAGF